MTRQKDLEQNETKHLFKYAEFTGKRVLEIGCGEGRLTWRYAQRPAVTVGIDSDRDALRVATIDRPSDLMNRVHFSNAQSEELPFQKVTFDLALFSWSF